ncbi:Abi family protein [Aquamicrobium zhengzhouense]|uniref:Abi family protein n=1 Tax=Aquamicrobium zhengzhouense TaxID=2781738 RepID=A0ABS0SFN3_9HYPH|nr:Abi family protein [Aquamicrobium zhengzhouense]
MAETTGSYGADEGEWLRQEAALKSRQVLNSDQRCEANAALSGRPATMAVELLDFGPLSIFLSGMRYADLKKIAASYGIPSRDGPHLIKSWIRSISALRNACAHHTRVWNRPLIDRPPCPIWVHCLTSII